MRIAYLEGFSGISGDMLLGAFIHAGVPADLLRETTEALKLGATLDIQKVDRSGIQATKVTVLIGEKPAEDSSHQHGHAHHHHHHDHRSLSTIRSLIEHASLPKQVKATAIRAFELLGKSEAKIHGVPIESIHFHEVGAVDSIVDVVLAAAAAHFLSIDQWHCSPLNVGGGTVQCAHGRYPVPAPATADLLQGAPTYSSGIEMELVTPTGAALVRALGCHFGSTPAMRVENIGYGAGTKNPPAFANVLRLSLGQVDEESVPANETVTVLETAIDDLNPQVVAYVAEGALKLGALDVMCQPVQMKKNRAGTLLTILADKSNVARLQEFIFRETSTLGIRIREDRRSSLERKTVSVATEWGTIRIKVGFWQGQEVNVAPEFEDCRLAAEKHSVPLKLVMESAVRMYREPKK